MPVIAASTQRRAVPLAWARIVPPWPLLIGLFVFARLLAARLALLNDPDTYLHIAAGRLMLAHAALPLHDPFSHTMPGAEWIASEWLAEIGFAFVFDEAGWAGVVIVTAAAFAATLALLTHFLLKRLPALPALVAVVASFALLEPHCLARPHALALPLMALWAGLLLEALDANRAPSLLALPIMLLWANMHGSFLFGVALAAFLAGDAVFAAASADRLFVARRWGLFVIGALVAGLLTPYGVSGVLQPFRLVGMPALRSAFLEWRSPDFQHAPELAFWLIGIMLIGYGAGIRLPVGRLILLLGLIYLTLQHSRHADLLAIVAPLALAAPLGARLAAFVADRLLPLMDWFDRLSAPAGVAASAVTAAAAVVLVLPLALHPIERGDDPVTPERALAAAERAGLSGPVFNSEGFGGYLAFRGVPTFIDGRIEMYGNDFLAADFRAENGDKSALGTLLERHRIAWALLMPQQGAAVAIEGLPGWEKLYEDHIAAVYRRAQSAAP